MTVAQSDRYNLYITTGGETVLVYDFPIYDANDIQIKRYRGGVDTILAITTDYTVTGVNNSTGGTVVLTAVALANDIYAVYGINEYTNTNFNNGGTGFSASAFNLGFNHQMNCLQQVKRDVDRCIHLPITETATTVELPHKSTRASKVLGFDSSGNITMYNTSSGAVVPTLTSKFVINTADTDLPNAQNLSNLNTGIATITTTTGLVGSVVLTGTANEITVNYGDGAGGDPTFSLPTTLTFTGKTITGGTYASSIINVNDSDITFRDEVDNTKTMKFQLSGITTGNLRTITIPDSSGTMLTTSFCTVPDNVFRLTDNGDATKVAVFEASSISTATTRTYTLPDASGTIALSTSPVFLDSVLRIQDNGDTTKQLAFECSTIGTGTTRTITIPDSNGIMLTTGTANISDSILRVQDNGDATKQLAFECSGITTGNTRTITIPDTSGTMLTTGTANVSDSILRIQDNGDATKQLAFECSTIATGTTRTITIPNSNGTMLTTGTCAVPDNIFTLQDNGDATKQAVFECSTIGTGTTRTFTFPNATGTLALTSDLSAYQPLDATLTSLAAYNTNGLITQTAADTFTGRTITGTANEITATNGNGVSGNPTLSLPSALTFTGKTVTGGTFTTPTINVNDDSFNIRDNGDTSKVVQFELSGLTTATTRTLTVADASGTIITSAALATQANQETATSTTTFVSPGRQHFHPSAAKAWGYCDVAGTNIVSYNVTSVTDTGAGQATINFTTAFSSANYSIVCTPRGNATFSTVAAFATGNATLDSWSTAGALTDPTVGYCFVAFGDQ